MRPVTVAPITCSPDSEWHEYDVWGEHDDGSLEGAEDGDLY
jgi:hypothetical protein